jgi:hypothetical protein
MNSFTQISSKYPAGTPEKARLQCLNRDYANHWMNARGTRPALRMSDPSFRTSICFRYGIMPFFFAPESPRLICDKNCQVDLTKDPFHRLHCNRENKRGRYHQHNNIQALLVHFAKSLGLEAEQTPGRFRFEDDQRTPDAAITIADTVHVIDVSGIDPLAPSHIKRNKAGPNKAAGDREKKKVEYYGDLVDAFDVEIEPFVYDLLGGLQESAVDLLKKIAKASLGDEEARNIRMREVHRCVAQMSIAIQRDNAQMLNWAFLNAKS